MSNPCEQVHIIKEIQERLHNGDILYQKILSKLDTIESNQHETKGEVTSLNKRLYIDNGRKSMQTIQDRHGRLIVLLIWLTSISTTALFGNAIYVIFFAGT